MSLWSDLVVRSVPGLVTPIGLAGRFFPQRFGEFMHGQPRHSCSHGLAGVVRHRIWSVAVMVTSLEDLHLFVVRPVHQPVLVIDATGPVARQVAF